MVHMGVGNKYVTNPRHLIQRQVTQTGTSID